MLFRRALSAVEPRSTPLPAQSFISTFFTAECLTSSPTHLYQKDERALPGDLHSRKLTSSPDFKSSVSHYPPSFSSLSLFGIKGLKHTNCFTEIHYASLFCASWIQSIILYSVFPRLILTLYQSHIYVHVCKMVSAPEYFWLKLK
jgi:hypothetical protein